MVQFCPRCGVRLGGPPPTHCLSCDYAMYVNARPTGGVVLVDGSRFLVLRRAREPKAGLWELPGGFCDGWEHPAEAAVREAREELGVSVRLVALIGLYVDTYEFQGELLPVLDCFWHAEITGGEIAPDPAEASAYAWADLGDPPVLAFDSMNSAIADLRSHLKVGAFGSLKRRAIHGQPQSTTPAFEVEEGP